MKTVEQAVNYGNSLMEERLNQTGELWYSGRVSECKHRIYVNLTYGRYYKGTEKWSRAVSYCIDLKDMKITDCSRRYNNAKENSQVSNIANEIVEFLNK